jgi:hypothetical protein
MIALVLFMVTVAADQRLNAVKDLAQALQQKQVEVRWAQGRERTCAIPLLNALKGPVPPNPMPIRKPEGTFHILQVVPPAPSCDEGKK